MVSALERFDLYKPKREVLEVCLRGIESLLLLNLNHRPVPAPRVPVASLVTLAGKAMRRYPNTTNVQALGCSLVKRLGDSVSRVPHQVREAGILSLALAAMERFPRNPELQAFCAGTVGLSLIVSGGPGDGPSSSSPSSSSSSSGDQGEEVAGAPALVVRGMCAFPADKDMQQMGCLVLGELDGRGYVPAGALGSAGAWGRVAGALSRFRRNVPVLEACCIAAAKMGGRETGVVPPGVGKAVAAALVAFPDDDGDNDDVRGYCLRAETDPLACFPESSCENVIPPPTVS
jgi:hypothetical protein